MNLILNNFKHQFNLRKNIPSKKSNIGSILKDKRKKMNLTLEEGALGICSVSYLSKVENNLIEPSDIYLSLFQKKYFLNEIDFSNIDLENIYDEIIEALINNRTYDYSFNHNDNNHKTKLCNFVHLVLSNKTNEANTYFDRVNIYFKNFNKKELLLFTLATSRLLKSNGYLKDAFDILNLISEANIDEKLENLISVEKLILATQISNHSYILIHLEKVIEVVIRDSYYHLAEIIKYNYFNYLLQYINITEFNKRLSSLKFLSSTESNYLSARFYYLKADYEKAESYISNNKDKKFLILSNLIFNKLNKLDKKYLLDISKEKLNIFEKQIIEYLKLKMLSNDEKLVNFIREEILKNNKLPSDYDQLHFWYEEAVYQLKKKNFYKEALLINQLIINELKHLTYYSN